MQELFVSDNSKCNRDVSTQCKFSCSSDSYYYPCKEPVYVEHIQMEFFKNIFIANLCYLLLIDLVEEPNR